MTRRGTVFGRVRRLEYHHADEDPDVIRVHDFSAGVELRALPDGAVMISHPLRRVWEEFPDPE